MRAGRDLRIKLMRCQVVPVPGPFIFFSISIEKAKMRQDPAYLALWAPNPENIIYM